MENKTNKNIEKILNVISDNKQKYDSLGFEYLGNLIYFLEKYDKKRDLDDH